jgi:hypothetical protein
LAAAAALRQIVTDHVRHRMMRAAGVIIELWTEHVRFEQRMRDVLKAATIRLLNRVMSSAWVGPGRN